MTDYLPLDGGIMTGPLQTAPGEMAAPSLAIGQADAGFFQIAQDQICFSVLNGLGTDAAGKGHLTIRGQGFAGTGQDITGDFFRIESYKDGDFFSVPLRVQRDAGVFVNDYLQVAGGQLPTGVVGMLSVGNDLSDLTTSTLALSNSPVANNDILQGYQYTDISTSRRAFTVTGDGNVIFGVKGDGNVAMIKPDGQSLQFRNGSDTVMIPVTASALYGGTDTDSDLTIQGTSNDEPDNSNVLINPNGGGMTAIGGGFDNSGAILHIKGRDGFNIISARDGGNNRRFGLDSNWGFEFSAPPATSDATKKNSPPMTFQNSYWNGSESVTDRFRFQPFQQGASAGQSWLFIRDTTDTIPIMALGNSAYGYSVGIGDSFPIGAAQLSVKSRATGRVAQAITKLTSQTADLLAIYDADGTTVKGKVDAVFNAFFAGVLRMGSSAVQLTDVSGKVNSDALNTVQTTQGGTGLTALGSPGDLIRVNAAGTGLEYFTP